MEALEATRIESTADITADNNAAMTSPAMMSGNSRLVVPNRICSGIVQRQAELWLKAPKEPCRKTKTTRLAILNALRRSLSFFTDIIRVISWGCPKSQAQPAMPSAAPIAVKPARPPKMSKWPGTCARRAQSSTGPPASTSAARGKVMAITNITTRSCLSC